MRLHAQPQSLRSFPPHLFAAWLMLFALYKAVRTFQTADVGSTDGYLSSASSLIVAWADATFSSAISRRTAGPASVAPSPEPAT